MGFGVAATASRSPSPALCGAGEEMARPVFHVKHRK